jgi:hypothetical protein
MYRSIVGLSLILVLSANTLSQSIVGKIMSEADNTPVTFANVGISYSKYGTYSDTNGVFEISTKYLTEKKSLLIRAVGFENREISNQQLLNRTDTLVIKLIPKVYKLNDIEVTANRVKKVRYGKKRIPSKALIWSFAPGLGKTRVGRSVAVLVEVPKEHLPITVFKASVAVFVNPFPNATFRVRFMDYDNVTETPSQDLTYNNYITGFGKVDGWVVFDLENENQLIDQEKFFLVFENLDTEMIHYTKAKSDSPFPLYMLKGFLLGKDKLFLSNAALNNWREEKEDLVFNFHYTYEKK